MMPARAGLALLVACAACSSDDGPPAGPLFFEREVQPILTNSCARGASGCHSAEPNDPFSFAAGNFDVTSYENVLKRPDLLRRHGVYPVPFLLAKAAGENGGLQITYQGQQVNMQVPHNGAILRAGSSSFLTLQTWLENGATRDGIRPQPAPVMGVGDCSTGVPDDFDEASVTVPGDFDAVQQVLTGATCNAGNCHGAPQSDFYLTCGDGARQRAWNYRQAWAFVGTPVESSEILQRPVAGGGPHGGGALFSSPDDPKYKTLADFAAKVGPMAPRRDTPGRAFFVDHVMPVILARGCGALGCHSPAAMNDLKLRGGNQGFFSAVQIEKNYRLIKDDFMAFEVPDVRRSRLVAKNILPANGGIAHRGGPLLEAGGGAADPTACGAWSAASSFICTFAEWSRLERQDAGNPNAGNKLTVVYVERDGLPPGVLGYASAAGGADLKAADLNLDAKGGIVPPLGNARSLLGNCGVGGAADVRGPDVKNDGETVVFAMRPAAGDNLQLWTVKTSGADCKRLLGEAGVDDFDPAWSHDGGAVVYASTKAGGAGRRLGQPQSDLWRIPAAGGAPERMTFLTSSEIGPQMMREGRVSMTTEKVDVHDPQGFYQLAGRRINWDLSDYHPLLGQREKSPVDPAAPAATNPSLGFAQATEIREGLDGNFVLVASAAGADGSRGQIAVFNRSIGPFENGRTDRGYLASVTFVGGSFRSPFQLPDGKIMASRESGGQLDLVAYNPADGKTADLLAGARSPYEAVVALKVEGRKPYDNRRQLVFGTGPGGATADAAHAVVHMPDAPMLATLLGANLRRGRDPKGFRMANTLIIQGADGATLGTAPLAADGSVRVRAPAGTPVYLGIGMGGSPLFMMSEEHQFGPGEVISLGVSEKNFDHVCAGCHGSVSGKEIDIGVTPDVLTGASVSASATASPTAVGP